MSMNIEWYKTTLRTAFPVEGAPALVATDEGDFGGIDAEEIRRDFCVGCRWDEIQDAALDRNCYSLDFFSDEAYRYYLPAFLLRALSNNEVYQFTIFSLAPEGPLDQLFFRRNALFNLQQVECIVAILNDAEKRKGYKHSNEVKSFWRMTSSK